MSRKEEILQKHYGEFDISNGWMFDGPVQEVFNAMDEYAKEVAIGFDMWKMDGYWQYNKVEGFYFKWDSKIEERATPDQLFNQYIQSLTK